MGSGCSTAVEHTPHDVEVVLDLFFYSFLFLHYLIIRSLKEVQLYL